MVYGQKNRFEDQQSFLILKLAIMVRKASIVFVLFGFLISGHAYGQAVLPRPGAQINEDKVDAILQEGKLSLGEVASANATEEDLENNIKKLKQLLRKKEVQSDKELQFSLHTMLGSTYLRLFEHTRQTKNLDRAIYNANTAVSIFENQPSYKADLADAYMIQSSARLLNKEYDLAISTMKYLIETYQEIGYGPYNNWFASLQVERLQNLASMNSLESGKRQEIVEYLTKIAQKYDNEVGISAQVSLIQHYFKNEDDHKIRTLYKSVKDRLAALDNPSFKKDKWGQAQTYLKRMENKKAREDGQSKRDTVIYEIKPEMVDTAYVKKSEVSKSVFVHVQLKEAYHAEFAELTVNNIGNLLAVEYKGNILSHNFPTILAKISGGRFSLEYKNEKKAREVIQQILGRK